MEDMKIGIDHLKEAKARILQATWIMNDHISKLKALEDENAALKDELGALQIQPDSSYMKLPFDADGVPIHLGDKMDVDGDLMNVLGYRMYNGKLLLIAKKAEGDVCVYTPNPSDVRHFKHEPHDSWEKLENDAKKTSCGYASAPRDENGLTTCEGCRFQKTESCSQEMTLDVLKRAKKLAGVEESEEASDD